MTATDISRIEAAAEAFRADYGKAKQQIALAVVGHEEIIDGVLTCLFANGHALLEGVPGIGKTLLIRSLAQALHLTFSRIQFTPDLMPADVTGTTIVVETEHGREFQFRRGPIFGQMVLADEINRATPKTQSALLEAMQEHSVTVGGETHTLDEPFFVMATQNPIEQEGTYPLPEAQLDRFFFKLEVGYSSREELSEILDRTTTGRETELTQVLDGRSSPTSRWCAPSSSPRTSRTTPYGWSWRRTRRVNWPRRWSTSSCDSAPAPARPRRWYWPARSGRCSTAGPTSRSTTCGARSCRRCGTDAC